jgi:nucleotide-binding universal stress UspA family protein
MSYKTIVVHCNDKRRVARVASAAAELASRFNAHLIGLSVSPRALLIPAGMPGTPDVIVDDARKLAYRKDNPELRHVFLEVSQAHGVEAEWRERDADNFSLTATVNDGLSTASARRVLIAWSDTREASRAVFDALPLLQLAEDVKVVSIGGDKPDPGLEDSDLDICNTLLRHKVKCKSTELIAAHTDIGRSLTQQAIAHKADLLVMGCYGHSRLSEFVLGGASRYQLRHMMIPVFMSH